MTSHHLCRFRSTLIITTVLVCLGLNLGPALASERPTAMRKLVRVGMDVGWRLVAPLRNGAARLGEAMHARGAAKPKLVHTPKRFLHRPGRRAVLLVALAALLTMGTRGCDQVDPGDYHFAEQATNERFRQTGKGGYSAPLKKYMRQHAEFSRLFKKLLSNPAAYEKDPPPELDSAPKVDKYMRENFGYPDFPSAQHASAALDLLSLAPTAPGREVPMQAAIRRVAEFAARAGPMVLSPGFGEAPIVIPLTVPIPMGAVSVAKKIGLRVVGHPAGQKHSNGIVYVEMSAPTLRPGPPKLAI